MSSLDVPLLVAARGRPAADGHLFECVNHVSRTVASRTAAAPFGGAKATAAERLLAHPAVRRLNFFIGSTLAARVIAEAAARYLNAGLLTRAMAAQCMRTGICRANSATVQNEAQMAFGGIKAGYGRFRHGGGARVYRVVLGHRDQRTRPISDLGAA
jgi:hypothetical protein